VLGPW